MGMRVAGTRTDGALWLVLDGGLSVLLRGDRCSPPVDPLEIEPFGPWRLTSGITGSDRRLLTRQLDRARTVPLYTLSVVHLGGAGSGEPEGHPFRGNQWTNGGGESGGKAGGGKARDATQIPWRSLTTEEKGKLDVFIGNTISKLAGPNPTGQSAKDVKTLSQSDAAYPRADNEYADGKAEHSFQQFTKPGTSFDDALEAMETGQRGVLTPERQALHDAVVRLHLASSTEVDDPTVVVMGGGPASGKSSMPKHEATNALTVDPDAIRTLLPDYAALTGGSELTDPDVRSASIFTHEEASALAKRIATEAGSKHNMIIDGTGDKSVESMLKKIDGYRKDGQRVVGRYATNATDEAFRRSEARAQEPPYRAVPEQTLRTMHTGVSRVLPGLMKRDVFDHVELWDTNVPFGSPARLVMSKARGQSEVIHDKKLWNDFLAKGEGFDVTKRD
jgi:hypothetical protein